MTLFEEASRRETKKTGPLAVRMRPRTLDEFVGQGSIVGKGRLLRRSIETDQLSSLIFYGPPGTGKTTLAQIIANQTKAHFIAINAVLSGVKEIRDSIVIAEDQRNLYKRRTILFVDEVHRFNKSQQDALLPHVENGTIILIGATTENPYFEVNKALVSRSRVFALEPLTPADLQNVLEQTITDPERGYGIQKIEITPDAAAHLVNIANGDARALLNAIELAVESTPPDEEGIRHITLEVAEESIQRRAVRYDKTGDAHYDTISAFIKAMRGSDPDAALYYLAKMIYAGEDPRFIFRRMIILAAEDVGMADPNAIRTVMACAQAYDYVGLPEGRYHLSEACIYLATAAKSNSAGAIFEALATVEKEMEQEPPDAMKDSSRDRKGMGHGEGYMYDHEYPDHLALQTHLPTVLKERTFYQPGDQGYEGRLKERVEWIQRERRGGVENTEDSASNEPPSTVSS